ncbi:hypothetical protein IGI04_036591 [Brassica rapa subsp. trilocularis]|uniref:Uncharacterized protein n=1 Tax=Brassica rapa subsp. trilocularis TaxID=1813537 RepID=A0ABQ7LH62_BRACM|nr:hypothetical protein IGI04_036591 [Brassica rapa subsp. trilocularis]
MHDALGRLWLCCIVAEHPPFLHLPSTRALLSTLSLESDDFLRDCLVHGLHSLELSLFSHQSSFSQSHLGPFFGSRSLGNWRRKQVVGLSLIAVCPPVAPIVRRMLSQRRAALGLPVRDPQESDPTRQQPSNPTDYFDDM